MTMRLIDAEALENKIKEAIEVLEKDLLLGRGNWFSEIKLLWYKKILKIVNNAPTIEVVPKELYEQILLERNIAMKQLEEHGIGFDAKKKNGVEANPIIEAHWIKEDDGKYLQ